MVVLNVNGKTYKVDVSPDETLLWVIREHLKLTGTKYGCGLGICGTCVVHIDGKAERSCQLSAGDAQGKKITTIEGLSEDHPIKRAWIKEQVPQCGYCQSGQIMQAASLIAENPHPSEKEIVDAMNDNLCRCGTYQGILRAIKRTAREVK